uniref:Uncharacterized protein n=1 Tax=Rhizophora mucronata TaxID=61149 RepID=A0A2P2IZ19_RHIMU
MAVATKETVLLCSATRLHLLT